jgi:hypothetical protein
LVFKPGDLIFGQQPEFFEALIGGLTEQARPTLHVVGRTRELATFD